MNENSSNDIDACRAVLREIADLCEHASLTGSLSGGATRVVRRYNAIVNQMLEEGRLPHDLFEPLPDSAAFGEIGVEARMLSAFLRKENKEKVKVKNGGGDPGVLIRLAPFVRSEDLAKLVRQQMEDGTHLDMDLVTHLAPFLNQDTLSDILQDHLQGKRNPPPAPPAPPTPPAREVVMMVAPAPTPTPAPAPAPEVSTEIRTYGDATPTRVPISDDKLLVLLDRLKDPRISHEDRAELIERIRALTAE